MVSLNKIFYGLFVSMLVFGLYFYQLRWFKPIDELITLLFASLCLLDILGNKNHTRYKGLFLIFGIMTFYLLYSMYVVHYNTRAAIFSDFFIQIKPFIAFYVAYSMGVKFNSSQKESLKRWCIRLSVFLFLIVMSGMGVKIFFHVAYYGIISTVLFFIYYYCSGPNLTKRDKIIMMLILVVGLLSTRSKFYGFLVIATYVIFFFKPSLHFRITFKKLCVGLMLLACVLYVAWTKIDFYFVSSGIFSGITNIADMDDSFARVALYMVMPEVLGDHLIFGSGLASYATFSAGEVGYSTLLENYGIDKVWGLQEGDCPFMSDTFIPELAQFGIVGILLFIIFWRWVYRKIKLRQLTPETVHLYKLGLLLLAFLFIESVAGSVFLQGAGIISMILLGLVAQDSEIIKHKSIACQERGGQRR